MQKLKLQFNKFSSYQSGQVLFEILLAVAVLVGVVAVSVQLSQVSLQSAKTAGDRTQAVNLAREGFEAARAISGENWVNFYSVIKGSQYHPEIQSGKWVLVAGAENITIGGETYARYLVVDDVSRDPTTRDIETAYNSSNDDPSTQKVTMTITGTSIPAISYSQYISRWRNASPVQKNWQGSGGQTDNSTSGDSANFDDNSYFSKINLDITGTPGSLKLDQQ